MSVFVLPSSNGAAKMLLQFTVARPLVFCCKVKPGEGEAQETTTVFVVVQAMVSEGGRALEYSMVR